MRAAPLLLTLLACLGLPSTIRCEQNGRHHSDPQLESKINHYVDPYIAMNDLNGSILIAKNGRVVFNKSYGLANRELRVGIDANTKFRIGSISKQFTAAAILLLQERNALHLADPISKFIPGFPSGDRITLQTLLIHTSGVARDLPDHRNFSKRM